EHGGHVDRDADPFARAQAARIALPPVGPRRAVVVEVGVHVNEHAKEWLQDAKTPSCTRLRASARAAWRRGGLELYCWSHDHAPPPAAPPAPAPAPPAPQIPAAPATRPPQTGTLPRPRPREGGRSQSR